MKTWFSHRSGDTLPQTNSLGYEKGKQTGDGRKSDDFATDDHPELTDKQLDAMERDELPAHSATQASQIPRALISTHPATQRPGSPHPKRATSGTVRGGLSHLAHATAHAIEEYMLGSDSDEDVKLPKIPLTDRFAGVKERQEMFLQDAKQAAHGHQPEVSPFERYRTRMGERTGSSGLVEEKMKAENVDTNRPVSPVRNRSVEAKQARRLLVANEPLTLAPARSQPSTDIPVARSSFEGVEVKQVPRGSFEVASASAARSKLQRSPPVVRAPSTPPGEDLSERHQSIRTPLRSIEEGRTTQQVTRVQNVRVVQPRYLIPREFVYGFGAATVLGLCIGCVTLAIGIRNANYLRGPHSNSLIPGVQAELDRVAIMVEGIAAHLGVTVGVNGGR